MKPISVSIDVPNRREDVYDFLDVMANHETFTDHLMSDFHYSGPPSGIGSKAQVTVKAGVRTETVEIEVIAGERPLSIVERNIGANGQRIATGTYFLRELPDHGTEITFEYAWQQAPLSERIAAPLARRILRQANQRALVRLAERLR